MLRRTALLLLIGVLGPTAGHAQQIQALQKVSATEGNFSGLLDEGDRFGSALAVLGDLDGDGVTDLAVGATRDDDGEEGLSADRGAVWILFLHADGRVKAHQKISALEGGFTGLLDDGDGFGSALAPLGDLDGDGTPDLAVGADSDDDGGPSRGAVWILFLQADGRVKAHQKISALEGGFTGLLDGEDFFGSALAPLGDLDGDSTPDLAVGAPLDDRERGVVWILFLQPDGRVKRQQKISALEGGFTGVLDDSDRFGSALAALGDLDGNGTPDLAAGAPLDDDGGSGRGALWILLLRPDGFVTGQQKISALEGGFTGVLDDGDRFGSALAALGDLDGKGIPDLAVGAWDDDGGADQGALWVLFLQPGGSVEDQQKISALEGGFTGVLDDSDFFGSALAAAGDLDQDGHLDLAVGAPLDDDGGATLAADQGAFWIIFNVPLAPPRIEDLQESSGLAIPGADIRITARINAVSGVSGAAVSFRRGGDPGFFSAPMNEASPGSYAFTIPAFAVSDRGVEYFVEAASTAGVQSRYPSPGFVAVPVFVPEGLTRLLVHGSEASAYRLVSIPLDLEDKNARAVLEDDLGPYDKTRWRFFGHQQGEVFAELDAEDLDMAPGRAFWLLVKAAGQTIGTGPGTTVATATPFRVPLHPGWNLVGNPFNFPIPISQVRTQSGQPVDMRAYEGFWNAAGASLQPFGGRAVFNALAEPDTLLIDPDGSTSAGAPVEQRRASEEERVSWAIRIVARRGQASDMDNLAVVAEGAAASWDPLDRPEPPSIGDYVSVYFPHPAWGRNTARFSTDARPAPSHGERWRFDVITRTPGKVVLDFEGMETVPAAFAVWLVDETLQVSQDLRTTPRYVLAGAGRTAPSRFRLVVGVPTFIGQEQAELPEAPDHYRLFPPFPNPFNPVTTIRYSLPAPQGVSMEIYNVLGERVTTIVSEAEQAAGIHTVIWEGHNDTGGELASGLYVLRMRAGTFVATQPMVLIR